MTLVRTAVAATLIAVAGAGCLTAGEDPGPSSAGEAPADDWRRLPEPPLTPRDHAVVVGVGDRMLVVGGWEFLCPPMADCSFPDAPLLHDGAVYDSATDSWSEIAAPPFGVRRQEYSTAALGGSAFLLTGCADGPAC